MEEPRRHGLTAWASHRPCRRRSERTACSPHGLFSPPATKPGGRAPDLPQRGAARSWAHGTPRLPSSDGVVYISDERERSGAAPPGRRGARTGWWGAGAGGRLLSACVQRQPGRAAGLFDRRRLRGALPAHELTRTGVRSRDLSDCARRTARRDGHPGWAEENSWILARRRRHRRGSGLVLRCTTQERRRRASCVPRSPLRSAQ